MKLTLIRGIPGSGKTTLAEALLTSGKVTYHFEADMFFIDKKTKEYKFDANLLASAHNWCYAQTDYYLSKDYHVVVSNTFTTYKEIRSYLELAEQLKIEPQIITCQGDFGSVHDVPKATLEKMRKRFQYNIKEIHEQNRSTR